MSVCLTTPIEQYGLSWLYCAIRLDQRLRFKRGKLCPQIVCRRGAGLCLERFWAICFERKRFNYVRTLLHWCDRPESLQTKSRDTTAQNLDGQSPSTYHYMCALSSPEAGGPKFLKTDFRPTNEKTIAEQPSPAVSVSASPLPAQVDQNF